jgi:photosystem II stability/assembly factor-like uncharacterized protein
MLPVGISFYRINGIYFINRNTGWLTGQHINSYNQIAKTTNGGVNWTLICQTLKFQPGQIYMFNENRGFVIGWAGWDTLASTSNGGYDWNYFRAGDTTGQPIKKILFLDSLNGWLLGWNAYVCRTANGGINWTFHRNNIWNTADIFFLDNLTGWIAERSRIWKSTNGGINWSVQLNTTDNYGYYQSIYFKNQFTGWACSDAGTVIKSTNGGTNWFGIIEPPYGIIYDIYFANKYTGWACGNYSDDSYLSKTVNGGNNWFNNCKFSNINLYALYFINTATGFVTGTEGKIFKTVNEGQTWDSTMMGNYSYNSIDFESTGTGWICGSGGQILKTTNTGLNWINQISGTSYTLNSIQFVNQETGYIVGDSGKMLKTTDGGVNWIMSQLSNYSYRDLFFLNPSTGWAVGNRFYGGGMYWGTEKIIVKTTDAGSSWASLYSGSSMYQGYGFMSVWFIDQNTGWVATRYNGILKTTNGGLNWFSDSTPLNNDEYNTIYFIDNETGWVAGGYNSTGCGGTVLTTGNFPIGINEINSSLPNHLSLSQNYPNPFNPVTKIKYDIPPSKGARGMMTKLIIFDILGREIETLVNETQRPGSYEVTWDGSRYASGVYFYRLITDDPSTSSGQGYVETKKMVLIK